MAFKTRMVLTFAFVVGLAVSFELSPVDVDWGLWKEKYNKVYMNPDEESLRQAIWLDHYKLVAEHYAKKDRQFEMELNEFSDQILPRKGLHTAPSTAGSGSSMDRANCVPASWDWRDHGAVGPVINQGMINYVVSIVATESVESFTAIKGGKLVNMSIAETKQCCVPEPILSVNIFTCLHNIGGLCSAANYPASAGTCRNDSCTAVGTPLPERVEIERNRVFSRRTRWSILLRLHTWITIQYYDNQEEYLGTYNIQLEALIRFGRRSMCA